MNTGETSAGIGDWDFLVDTEALMGLPEDDSTDEDWVPALPMTPLPRHRDCQGDPRLSVGGLDPLGGCVREVEPAGLHFPALLSQEAAPVPLLPPTQPLQQPSQSAQRLISFHTATYPPPPPPPQQQQQQQRGQQQQQQQQGQQQQQQMLLPWWSSMQQQPPAAVAAPLPLAASSAGPSGPAAFTALAAAPTNTVLAAPLPASVPNGVCTAIAAGTPALAVMAPAYEYPRLPPAGPGLASLADADADAAEDVTAAAAAAAAARGPAGHTLQRRPDGLASQFNLHARGQLSKQGGPSSSRRCITVSDDGNALVACLYGRRCTCDKTHDDECKAKFHPYDSVAKYYLVYRNQPAHGPGTKKTFKVEKEVALQLTGQDSDLRMELWEPEEARAVLWHVKERIDPRSSDPARANRKRKRSAGDADAAEPADPRLHRQRPPQPGELWALQGRAGPAGVQEPWLGSLERIWQYLRVRVKELAQHLPAEPHRAVRQLLAGIPGEHLLQMRIPIGGGGLAHVLVTPPRCLLAEDESAVVGPPPQNPDEWLPEGEAVDMIQAVVERLAAEAGGSMEVALRQWSEMLGAVDDRYGATAVHRAGRYGHRLKVLVEWVLPYASRAALLQPTSHIYLCYHSAARSGRQQAANLLLAAVAGALQDLARAPELQQVLASELSTPSSPTAMPAATAAGGYSQGDVEKLLISKGVYTLKNKFFRGQNRPEEGFKSPPGSSGQDVLTQACAEWRVRLQMATAAAAAAAATAAAPDAGAFGASDSAAPAGAAGPAAAARMPYMAWYGPQRPFPSPAPPDKKRMAEQLGGIKFAAKLLDRSLPRLLRTQRAWWTGE